MVPPQDWCLETVDMCSALNGHIRMVVTIERAGSLRIGPIEKGFGAKPQEFQKKIRFEDTKSSI
jgi:hypothetical protein